MVKLSYNLALYYPESEGMEYMLLVNGEPIDKYEQAPIKLVFDESADSSIMLSVKEGDEIALVVSSNKKNTLNAAAANITVEYQS